MASRIQCEAQQAEIGMRMVRLMHNSYVEDTMKNNDVFDSSGLVGADESRKGRLKYWTNELCAKRPHTFDIVIAVSAITRLQKGEADKYSSAAMEQSFTLPLSSNALFHQYYPLPLAPWAFSQNSTTTPTQRPSPVPLTMASQSHSASASKPPSCDRTRAATTRSKNPVT